MNKKFILVVPIVLLALVFGLFMSSLGIYYVWVILQPGILNVKANIIDPSPFLKFFNGIIKSSNKLFKVYSDFPLLINNKVVCYAINASFCFLFALISTMIFLNASIRWFKGRKSLFPYVYAIISLGFLAFTIFNDVTLLFLCSFIPLLLLIMSLPTFVFYINRKTIVKEKQIKKIDDVVVEEIKQTMNEIEQRSTIVEEVIDDFEDDSFDDVEEELVEQYEQPLPNIEKVIQPQVSDSTMKVDQQRLLEQEQETNKNLEELKNRANGLSNFLLNANQPKQEPILEQPIAQPQFSPTERVQNIRESIGEDRIRRPYPDVVQIDQNRLIQQENETYNILSILKNRVSILENHLANMEQEFLKREVVQPISQPQFSPTERVQNIRESIGEDRIRPPHPEILKLDQEKIIEQIIASEKNIMSLQNKFADIQSRWNQQQPIVSNNEKFIDAICEEDVLEDEEIDEIIVDQKPNLESFKNIDQNLYNQIPQQQINSEAQVEIMRVNQQSLLERQQFANQNIDLLKNRFSDICSNWNKQQTINQTVLNQNVQNVQQSNNFTNLSNNSEIQKMFELIKNNRQHRG